MRTIYLLAMCLWLNACTAATQFPLEVTNDMTTDETSVIPAWKERGHYTAGAHFVSTKVQLAGQVTQIIPKPGGVIILAEERPTDRYLSYGLTGTEREGVFTFAVVFPGFPDEDMLQAGNHLAVVGEMDGSRPEPVGSMPSVALPHLLARCLHIWKTEGVDAGTFRYEDSVESSHFEKRTFCRKEDTGRNLSTGNDSRFQVPTATGG